MPPTAGKRPLSQAMPEPAPEPIQGTAIVVIHPGSRYLRIGRAADTYPQTIPHCIARLQKNETAPLPSKGWINRPESMHPDAKHQQRQGLRLAEEAVRYRPTSLGRYRHPTNYKELYQVNAQNGPEETDITSPINWTSTMHKPQYMIGEEALYVHPDQPYTLSWPMRHGRLNIHSGPGGTITSIMQDLENIWGAAIQGYLEIPLKDLKHYRAVLLVSDIYERPHVREMMSVLLNKLGFGAAFACQESVCATFGAGVSSACVLDVGDQKVSVCCVEDGLSQKATRLTMEYGGCDITRIFHWLVSRAGFPYRQCSLNNKIDAVFLQDLKESQCHMELEQSGVKEAHMQLKVPGQRIVKYSMRLGDETILAPMALFYPDILGLQGAGLWRTHYKARSDPADPHDEEYLMQTQSRQEQAARQVAARKKEARDREATTEEGGALDDPSLMDDDDTNEATADAEIAGPSTAKSRRVEEETVYIDIADTLIGIDQAILQSIDKCDADDIKKRMYGCIVVVGGGASMFRGAEGWIKYAVWTQMPPHFRLQLETMDVITQPKEFDPRLTCWKGGAILSCLDTAQELWIRQREWKRFGARMLRERAPFIW